MLLFIAYVGIGTVFLYWFYYGALTNNTRKKYHIYPVEYNYHLLKYNITQSIIMINQRYLRLTLNIFTLHTHTMPRLSRVFLLCC